VYTENINIAPFRERVIPQIAERVPDLAPSMNIPTPRLPTSVEAVAVAGSLRFTVAGQWRILTAFPAERPRK